jgi:hypothetical protein
VQIPIESVPPVRAEGHGISVRHRHAVVVAREEKRVLPDRRIVLLPLVHIADANIDRVPQPAWPDCGGLSAGAWSTQAMPRDWALTMPLPSFTVPYFAMLPDESSVKAKLFLVPTP